MKSSPSQRHVLSHLVAARKIIRKKFKRAYDNRITRERDAKEVFKPILTSIDTLSKKNKARREREEEVARPPEDAGLEANRIERPIHIYRHRVTPASAKKRPPAHDDTIDQRGRKKRPSKILSASKTPVGSLIVTSPRKTRSMSQKKRRLLEDSVVKSSKRRHVSDTPIVNILETPRSSRYEKRLNRLLKGGIDVKRFEYEVVGDSQNIESYHKPPNDHSPMSLKETSKLTNNSRIIKAEWVYVPEYAKLKWLQHRKKALQAHRRNRTLDQIEDMDIDLPQPVNWKGNKRRKENDSYQEDIKKRREGEEESEMGDESDVSMDGAAGSGMKPLDFDFIPYNANNRIVYEYFDDPNELCDRLRLLVSSKMAGNTNHMQEINSIIEELRELGCIV